jgi:hypothetical protein
VGKHRGSSAAKAILAKLELAGYSRGADPQKFIVSGKYGLMKGGEIPRARTWGQSLQKLQK